MVLPHLEEVTDSYQNVCVIKSQNIHGIMPWEYYSILRQHMKQRSFTCRSYTSYVWLRMRFDTVCLLPFLAEIITDSLQLSLKARDMSQ